MKYQWFIVLIAFMGMSSADAAPKKRVISDTEENQSQGSLPSQPLKKLKIEKVEKSPEAQPQIWVEKFVCPEAKCHAMRWNSRLEFDNHSIVIHPETSVEPVVIQVKPRRSGFHLKPQSPLQIPVKPLAQNQILKNKPKVKREAKPEPKLEVQPETKTVVESAVQKAVEKVQDVIVAPSPELGEVAFSDNVEYPSTFIGSVNYEVTPEMFALYINDDSNFMPQFEEAGTLHFDHSTHSASESAF